MDEHDELVRLYGPWLARTPADAVEVLTGWSWPWWVAGGRAIEAFTGRSRAHGDLDIGIRRGDVAALQEHVAGRYDVWAADHGVLRPLVERVGRSAPATCSNLWLRRSGADPWEYDVLLTDVTDGIWTYKRDARLHQPLASCLFEQDDVWYLRPEVQLLHKAPGLRPPDEADFSAVQPLLDESARRWLTDALRAAHPGHPWLARLVGSG